MLSSYGMMRDAEARRERDDRQVRAAAAEIIRRLEEIAWESQEALDEAIGDEVAVAAAEEGFSDPERDQLRWLLEDALVA